MYRALRPILAVGDRDLWLMNTPRGKQGFFYKFREHGGPGGIVSGRRSGDGMRGFVTRLSTISAAAVPPASSPTVSDPQPRLSLARFALFRMQPDITTYVPALFLPLHLECVQ